MSCVISSQTLRCLFYRIKLCFLPTHTQLGWIALYLQTFPPLFEALGGNISLSSSKSYPHQSSLLTQR